MQRGQFLIFNKELKHITSLTLNQSKQLIHIVQYLYDSDIVHRDIRPQNLMLDYREKRLKLIDFGFAFKYEINEMPKKLPIFGTVTYATYELLTCYYESISNKQYAPLYDYERTFDLKCALNVIIYKISNKVQIELNAIEQLSPPEKLLRSLTLWENCKKKNQIYSDLLGLINNLSVSSDFDGFERQLEKLYLWNKYNHIVYQCYVRVIS
ncbi:unnamed protein product [Rotaria sordida]|uniref:Protein kinase domain-containing protein n=2 Tax=Rotaria sordida TaxID=392033 RepID=A0A818T3T1_9BILA|nr:unnamed protein product [Rotaria sordida]